MGNGADVLQMRHYAPYGEVWGEQGTAQTPFGFTGEPTDQNNLVHLRARYYNPTLGIFPSLDPLEGSPMQPLGFNRYAYVNGNPVNMVDPTGAILERPPVSCSPNQNSQSTGVLIVGQEKGTIPEITLRDEDDDNRWHGVGGLLSYNPAYRSTQFDTLDSTLALYHDSLGAIFEFGPRTLIQSSPLGLYTYREGDERPWFIRFAAYPSPVFSVINPSLAGGCTTQTDGVSRNYSFKSGLRDTKSIFEGNSPTTRCNSNSFSDTQSNINPIDFSLYNYGRVKSHGYYSVEAFLMYHHSSPCDVGDTVKNFLSSNFFTTSFEKCDTASRLEQLGIYCGCLNEMELDILKTIKTHACGQAVIDIVTGAGLDSTSLAGAIASGLEAGHWLSGGAAGTNRDCVLADTIVGIARKLWLHSSSSA